MSNGLIQLNKLICSNKGILFDTDQGVYVGHNEESNVMNAAESYLPKNNKWNFNILPSNIMARNIYPLSSFSVQSYQYKKSPSNRQNNISDFYSIYSPNTSYANMCQYFDYAYLLTDITNKSLSGEHLFVNSDVFATSYLSTVELPIKTYVYPSSANIMSSNSSSGEYTYVPLYNLSGINFNFIEECPLDFSYYGYEKDSSTSSYFYVYGDAVNAKNAYNHNYSLDSRVTSTTNTSSVSATVNSARTYYDIDSTGDLLYMVYKNDLKYQTSSSTSLSGTGVTFGMTPTSSFQSSGNIVDIVGLSSSTLSTSVINRFDNVEVIASINRISDTEGHKSNLFSINIQNSNIDSSPLSSNEKEYIKKSLSTIIESVIKNIIPANTQLLKIYWNGQ